MNLNGAIKFVNSFDVSGLIAAEAVAGADLGDIKAAYGEARNLVVLALKHPGVDIVPTQRGDRHALFESPAFLEGLREHGFEFRHHAGAEGDFEQTVALYRREFGANVQNAAGCLINAAGCLVNVRGVGTA